MKVKNVKKKSKDYIILIIFIILVGFVIQLMFHPVKLNIIPKIERKTDSPIFAKLYKDGTLILSSEYYSDHNRRFDYDYGDISAITCENYNEFKIGWIDVKKKLTFSEITLIGEKTEIKNKAKKVIIKDEIHPTDIKNWFYDLNLSSDVENLNNLKLDKIDNLNELFTNSRMYDFDFSMMDIRDNNINSLNKKLFAGKYIKNLSFRGIDFSKINDMSNMFYSARIENLDLSNFDTSNVTDMSYMFSGAKVENLDLSNFDTSNVSDMSYMFSGAKLENLDLSNFDTSNVTDMSYMFSGAKIKDLDLSNLDMSNVTNMSGMFSDAKIEKLDLSNFNTSNVTDMSRMFSGAKIEKLDLSNFDTSNVTNMDYMFSDAKIKELKLKKGNEEKIREALIYAIVENIID